MKVSNIITYFFFLALFNMGATFTQANNCTEENAQSIPQAPKINNNTSLFLLEEEWKENMSKKEKDIWQNGYWYGRTEEASIREKQFAWGTFFGGTMFGISLLMAIAALNKKYDLLTSNNYDLNGRDDND